MKIAIVSIIGKVATSMSTHGGGYTLILKNWLEDRYGQEVTIENDYTKFNNYSFLVINPGVNFVEDFFNCFGGFSDEDRNRFTAVQNFEGEVMCANANFNFDKLITKRKELVGYTNNKSCINKLTTYDLADCGNNRPLLLGDSHSLSVYKKGYNIRKIDGKTMHGFLRKGLKTFVKNTDELIFYAGNIDIRFHIDRLGSENNALTIIDSLLNNLEKQLCDLNLKSITLVELLPIENEDRVIPKSGMYKNKPFFGSKNTRQSYVEYFNKSLKNICVKNGFNLITWDFGNELSFNDMEARGSVHLRPTSYKYYKELI